MSDIVRKLEQFTNVTSVNGELQFPTNNNDEIDNNPLNNTNSNGNQSRANVTTPMIKNVIKFQNELKYKQILRDHEVKNTELQTKLDELTKQNEEFELRFESSDYSKLKSAYVNLEKE